MTVSGPDLQGTQTGVTDLSGQYVVPFLPAGKGYQVQAQADGFSKVVRKGIGVPLGATISLPFTLFAGTTVITVAANNDMGQLDPNLTIAYSSSRAISSSPAARPSASRSRWLGMAVWA